MGSGGRRSYTPGLRDCHLGITRIAPGTSNLKDKHFPATFLHSARRLSRGLLPRTIPLLVPRLSYRNQTSSFVSRPCPSWGKRKSEEKERLDNKENKGEDWNGSHILELFDKTSFISRLSTESYVVDITASFLSSSPPFLISSILPRSFDPRSFPPLLLPLPARKDKLLR